MYIYCCLKLLFDVVVVVVVVVAVVVVYIYMFVVVCTCTCIYIYLLVRIIPLWLWLGLFVFVLPIIFVGTEPVDEIDCNDGLFVNLFKLKDPIKLFIDPYIGELKLDMPCITPPVYVFYVCMYIHIYI